MTDIKPVAYRSRHKSDPGMIGHYPWEFSERDPNRYGVRPNIERDPLYAASDVADLVRQMRDALEATTRHFGFETLGKSGLRDSMVRGNAHAAIAAADAFLARQEAPKA